MPKIYVCGNPLLEQDNLPLKIIGRLQKLLPQYDFTEFDPNENIKPENKELIVIDTIINIEKITVLRDLKRIELDDLYSPHDFDLGYNILLLSKIGLLEKIVIFGIPPDITEEKALAELKSLIPKELK
jgi:hypothetical protein